MRSRNFNYIGDDLVKEWESSYLKNNPQIKKGGSRNLEEIWEKEVFPKSNEMINKLEKDCKSHIQKFQIFWDKVKEKEDLLFLNELIPKKLLGNEFDKMFFTFITFEDKAIKLHPIIWLYYLFEQNLQFDLL